MRGHSRLLKKVIGRSSWDSTTPMAMLDASVVTSKDLVKSGRVRVASLAMAVFSCSNECAASGVHAKVLFRRISVRPAAMVAYFGKKRM